MVRVRSGKEIMRSLNINQETPVVRENIDDHIEDVEGGPGEEED